MKCFDCAKETDGYVMGFLNQRVHIKNECSDCLFSFEKSNMQEDYDIYVELWNFDKENIPNFSKPLLSFDQFYRARKGLDTGNGLVVYMIGHPEPFYSRMIECGKKQLERRDERMKNHVAQRLSND